MKESFKLKIKNKSSSNYSIVGYGTFITRGYWKDKNNVEICLVRDYIRIFPPGNWFPYVLPYKSSSFYALKFDVNKKELANLDFYEGIADKYFERKTVKILVNNKYMISAFIYVPSKSTIKSQKLTPEIDKNDLWKEEIKKFPEIVNIFPELTL
ncbi:MAG: gamma-glutamylcyclotransferase family protein [Promethearchaeota archaeon]